jgi:hypothetical protein
VELELEQIGSGRGGGVESALERKRKRKGRPGQEAEGKAAGA